MSQDFQDAVDQPPTAVPPISKGSRRMVFAHYFPPYPLSEDDRPALQDYYSTQYLTVDGEGGEHAAYGGFLRDRPLPTNPTSSDWQLLNQETEVHQAMAAGINGFSVDILSLTSTRWAQTLNLLHAAQAVSDNFVVMAMPDMTSLRTSTPEQLATALATFASYKAAYRLSDGRLVVSPFAAEIHTPVWYSQVFSILSSRYRIRVAFVPLFVNCTQANLISFSSISYGFSNWGARSPGDGNTSVHQSATIAHAAGKIWMQPVAIQDERPRSGVYWEADNTTTLRDSWADALNEKADWVQLVTWNDFSEGTQFEPSMNAGWSFLNATSYYIQQFETGHTPAVIRDLAVLTYRTQLSDAPTVVPETQPMRLVAGSNQARDDVEMLTILAKPAMVVVNIGGSISSYVAPAGVSAHVFPLRTGSVAAQVISHGKVVLGTFGRGFPVKAIAYNQDLSYHAVTLINRPAKTAR